MKTKIIIGAILFSLTLVGVFLTKSWGEQNKIYNLTLATGAKTGEYYRFGQAFAKVVTKYHSDIKIQVLETPGSVANQELLEQKKVDLALVQNDANLNVNTRVISPLFPEMFHLIARLDSGINDIRDIKGKRVGLMSVGSGSYNLFWPLIKHYGIEPKDIQAFPSSADKAYKDLSLGKLDVVFRIIAVGNAATIKLVQDTKLIKLVPIDQAEALNLFFPVFEASKIPKGTYNGSVPIPAEDLPTIALRSLLITNETTPRSLVNDLTRTLFDSSKEIAREHPASSLIVRPNDADLSSLLFHEGALDYYNNTKPNFFVANADIIALLMSIGALIASGIWQVRIWLQQKQKNRADRYNAEILELIKQIETAQDLTELNQVRHRLFDIFNTVIIALDRDKISEDSLQSFSFTWNVALSSIRHKEFTLNNMSKNEFTPFRLQDY